MSFASAKLKSKSEKKTDRGGLNPLVIAVFAAAVAAVGNATVAWLNGLEQRNLERTRAEQAQVLEETKAEASRILEAIKTINPDKAAGNLKFLLDAGLISDPVRRKNIQTFLKQQPAGATPTLPPIDRPDVQEACKRFPSLC